MTHETKNTSQEVVGNDDDARYEPADEEPEPDEFSNCAMYWCPHAKGWTCPNVGSEWCDFPSLDCTGD